LSPSLSLSQRMSACHPLTHHPPAPTLPHHPKAPWLPTYLLFPGKANEMLLIVLRILFRFNFANVSVDKRVCMWVGVVVVLYTKVCVCLVLILRFVVIYQWICTEPCVISQRLSDWQRIRKGRFSSLDSWFVIAKFKTI